VTANPIMLISAAARRLLSGRVPVLLWVWLVTLAFAPSLLFALSEFPPLEPYASATSLVLGVGVLALMLVVFWKLERAVANYQDRRGDPFAWFGWTLVAYLPVFAVALAMWRLDIEEDFLLQETIAMAALSLAAPILVQASGRAIDQHGPDMTAIWQSWLPNYRTLIAAYLLVTLPLYLASDIAWYFLASDGSNVLLGDLIAGLLSTIGAVLAIALTVEAFHRAEVILPS
jgi:hypothetical protein